MHICAAWLLMRRFHFSIGDLDLGLKAMGFYERAVQLDPEVCARLGAAFSCACGSFTSRVFDKTSARRDATKSALENAQRLQPNSAETLLALGYYQYRVLRDYGLAKTTFKVASVKCYRVAARSHTASAELPNARDTGMKALHFYEQALTLDPRNVELLIGCRTRTMPWFDNSRPRESCTIVRWILSQTIPI